MEVQQKEQAITANNILLCYDYGERVEQCVWVKVNTQIFNIKLFISAHSPEL